MKKNIISNMLIVSIFTAVFGQMYMNPFNTEFRFSIGIIILAVLLMKFDKIPLVYSTVLTGAVVVLFRVAIGYFSGAGDILGLLYVHYPAFFFYLSYGILLKLFKIRKNLSQPILLITFLGFSDVLSNIVEATIRYEFSNISTKIVLSSLFFVGFMRAAIIFILNLALVFYNLVILKNENAKNVKEFLVLVSKMKTESFFLRKGMEDIENAMSKSYYIYSYFLKLENNKIISSDISDIRHTMLELSKDIHEVKKDNERVIAGIEKIIPHEVTALKMTFSEIIEMLVDNTSDFAKLHNKDIKLNYKIESKKIQIKKYYPLITILINLLSNAVDAISKNGDISLVQYCSDENFIIEVVDNGVKIKESERKVIFSPGYSTKYNKKTGKMSNGLGLTHVKTLVKDYYDGDIELIIDKKKWKVFRVIIPKNNLVGDER